MKAREVLEDCKLALQLLEEETNPKLWRIHWVAAVALIRAVGHVLHKVGGSDMSLKEIINQRHKLWTSTDPEYPEHRIFRQFIELERNNILKEYQSNVYPLAEIPLVVGKKSLYGDNNENDDILELFELDENLYKPLMDGPWEGEDARDVLREAISWWEKEIDAVRSLSKKNPL